METIIETLAVRETGDVPLVGDDRWSDEYWEHVQRRAGMVNLRSDTEIGHGRRRSTSTSRDAKAGYDATSPHDAHARRNAETEADPSDTSEAGIAWATFSSGSTGTPRVIIRSESSWSQSFSALSDLLGLTESDTVYLPAPLVSSMSLFSLAHARATGAALIVPRNHSITPGDLERATIVHCTPIALRTIVDAIEAGAHHRLRAALVGGAAIDPGLRTRAEVAGVRIVSYYGAAELSFVAVDVDGHGLRAFPGVETRIEARNRKADGGTSDTAAGVLWVRSPYFAAGYVSAPEPGVAASQEPPIATSPATPDTGALSRDDQGWATVGDLVELDTSGRMLFRGRRDGAILTAAATVIPEDVEAALRTIEGVDDVVVFGLPNSGAGSLVAAVIETSADAPRPRIRELREQAENRMSLTHLPRRWYVTDRLPRNSAGKPARAQIRADAIEGRLPRLD
ncbi:fatty acid--CoA ligase family protein [Subtercola sp. PAMC28395]|uniref:class I adenylate-forming enzyme family protein n=1 Tax=Subtercola sp. PAMC28395 TaxID=2846775 RepID=UPI001C0AEA82|nr:fatty acid--CoA ligase family protein [Subtercola sp. PAMC28395]QWT23861.1 fatty acid--CoA ligase family protein [Subtercola sp. PAMC28395]